MKRDLSLRLWASTLSLLVLSTACEVRLKDMDEDAERDVVQMESWSSGPGSSTYNFVKCSTGTNESALSMNNVCGTRLNGESAGLTYNWQTNCAANTCGTVSVFAHYMLTENLGPQKTLRIEAFTNPQFTGSPVSSLEIQGFDASKPASSGLEEIFLAPGEYYFRAYLSPEGSAAIPYSLQGMELVSDTPVGVLGALSGAQRVLVKNTQGSAEAVHIYINQLFKKPVPAVESFAKIRLDLSLSEDQKSKTEKYRDVHVLLLKQADLELKPNYDFTLSTTALITETPSTTFVSPSVEPGSYYIFAFIDANSNRYFDETEIGAYILGLDGKPALVSLEIERTKGLKLDL
ncbi:MAG: hypothetical protein EOP10_08240 [Proteobacteria bacterium]|nr:MAG: hypothetical protein EOP10_08240 [Pseudomonadota bacterium]